MKNASHYYDEGPTSLRSVLSSLSIYLQPLQWVNTVNRKRKCIKRSEVRKELLIRIINAEGNFVSYAILISVETTGNCSKVSETRN